MDKLTPKKSLGQHWLNDAASLEAMAAAADVQAGDVVLEIGPGPGTLTQVLLDRGAEVYAVEKDEALAQALIQNLQNPHLLTDSPFTDGRNDKFGKLTVFSGDILQFDLTHLPAGYKVAANIPYYLTSNLIRVLSESANPPLAVALLIQKEVAERVCATPGDMSILSVTAQFYWQVNLGSLVPAQLFTPPPKVDSQILVLRRRTQPLFDVDTKQFFRLVKAGFSQKRKTLVNSLSGGLAIGKDQARAMLEQADIGPNSRAQALSLEQWHALYLAQVDPK